MKKKQAMGKDFREKDFYEEDFQGVKARRAKKNKKTYAIYKYLLFGVVLLIIGAGILFSPLFEAKTIIYEGNEHFSDSEIASMIGISAGDNVILFDRTKAENMLKSAPYIAEANITMKLPDTLIVRVAERKVRGYVPYMGAYLYIDEEGRVLETQDAYYETLPEVKGLKFDSFKVGEILPVDDDEALLAILQMSQMMRKYELLDIVVAIDVSNPRDIYAYVNQVTIYLGELENGDQKIRVMAEIVKTIAPEDRGVLDLSDLSKPLVFQYLT